MDNIRSVEDEIGNLLLCKDNGSRITVSLKLKSERRYRKLGIINREQKSISIKRNSGKHLMRKFSGYGFNHKLLVDSKTFDTIRLSDENSSWTIPKQFILDNGKYLNFKSQGFELQIFISLNDINQFLTKPKF